MEAEVCHKVYPFVHTSLLENIHCNESLVWFETSGFCYILSVLDPHWNVSQISCGALCHGDPAALHLQDWPFHALQQFIPEVDVGMGQLKALDLSLGSS